MKLSGEELLVLRSMMMHLRDQPWVRPMDVGGYSGSGHSRLLGKFVKQGLAERRARNSLRNMLNAVGVPAGRKPRVVSWEYRVTLLGQIALLKATPAPAEFVQLLEALLDLPLLCEGKILDVWTCKIGSSVTIEHDKGQGLRLSCIHGSLSPKTVAEGVEWIRKQLT